MQTIIVIVVMVGILVFFIYRIVKYNRNTPLVADHENMITLTQLNFNHQTKGKLILVDFWAPWCMPCRMMAPVLNNIAGEVNGIALVGKVNIEENQELALQFNVRSIPTLILMNNGVEVNRFVGVKHKEFLLKQIQNYAS